MQESEYSFWIIPKLTIGILALAFILRIIFINVVPPSLSLDEVSIGWNAYSILKTGVDEYGSKYPILLRAYDDYRPALYVYCVLPFIVVFGLIPIAIRFPSILISLFGIIAVYYLIKLFFIHSKQNIKIGKIIFDIPILVTFLLAISPWNVYLSRLGHEVNLGFSLVMGGLLFFFAYLYFQKGKYLYLSGVLFALSLSSYQSEKIIVPLLVLSLILLYRKFLVAHKKTTFIAFLLSISIVLPSVFVSISPAGLSRLRGTSAFTSESVTYKSAHTEYLKLKASNRALEAVLFGPKVTYLRIFFNNYLSHFDPRWLFGGNDNESHKAPRMGLFYLWEFPFIILGIFTFLKSTLTKRHKALITLLLFISPLPAAITTQAPHAMRSYTMLPVFYIFIAFGIFTFLKKYQKRRYMAIGCVLATLNIFYLLHQYFIVFPITQSQSFQYALAQTIPYIIQHENEYEKIIFTNIDQLQQSYMFYLFYSKYDPILYQSQGGTKSGGFEEEHSIGKYEFRRVYQNETAKSKILYVINNTDTMSNGHVVKAFRQKDDNTVISLITL